MALRRLIWKILPSYLIITLFAVAALTVYARSAVRQFHRQHIKTDLISKLDMVANHVQSRFEGVDQGFYDYLTALSRDTDVDLSLFTAEGLHVAGPMPAPEIADARMTAELRNISSGAVTDLRHEPHLDAEVMYAARRISLKGQPYILRAACQLEVENRLQAVIRNIIGGGLFIALAAVVMSYVLSRKISRALQRVRGRAEEFASGDFTQRVPTTEYAEINELGNAMNWMATQLGEKINMIQQQRKELDGVLNSMAEGVLAVNMDHIVIRLNPAAAAFFGADPGHAEGRHVTQVIRNPDMQDLIRDVLEAGAPLDKEIVSYVAGEQRLAAHGTLIQSDDHDVIGCLVIIHDVSQLRQMEQVRRDFVANVSHELKTPITSIKGFAETLVDGDHELDEAAEKYISIIARQSDRVASIIEDLLALSRAELSADGKELQLEEILLTEVVDSAMEMCAPRAEEKQIRISMTGRSPLTVSGNFALLEQAVINLLDNAIKYSPEQTEIKVQVKEGPADRTARIVVVDQGAGIKQEHLSRLFERFYRVDKARSRQMGGTGLGLSIVKHIAQVHGGYVGVESDFGQGSRFYIVLPVM